MRQIYLLPTDRHHNRLSQLSSANQHMSMSNNPLSVFKLSVQDVAGVEDFLARQHFLEETERVERLEVAGEGNMNAILRVLTNRRSIILKQSLPYVRKFPSVPAPVERITFENSFYQIVRANPTLRSFTPEIHFFDEVNNILCMEDFGPAADFTFIYKRGAEISKKDMADVARVVSELHYRFRTDDGLNPIQNQKLRELNHAHIFHLPLQENNGFELDAVTDGLATATKRFRTDVLLKKRAEELGQRYLNGGGTRLLHGDYYPGSWLKTEKGFRMIDPEFCYTGLPEFELGVLIAHLKMAQQPDSRMKDMFVYYHFDSCFDGSLFSQFAGMEIIRRLTGLAQLPLELTLKERLSLLDEAYELVVHG